MRVQENLYAQLGVVARRRPLPSAPRRVQGDGMRRDAVTSPDPPRLLTAEEVALRLGLTRGAVYNLSYLGRLPGKTKLGRRVRWQADVIEAIVRNGM